MQAYNIGGSDNLLAQYRPCVGICLFNRDGLVFLGRRVGQADDDKSAWQWPQGGIDPGEEPDSAALRELFEETGVPADKVELLDKTSDWLTYDLPKTLRKRMRFSRWRGQKQLWYAYRFLGEDADINLEAGPEAEFDGWRWAPLSEGPLRIIDFKREVYVQVAERFARHAGPLGAP